MIVIVCVDNHNGMAFNHRRQSRDEKVLEYLKRKMDGKPLYCSPYSKELFTNYFPVYALDDYQERADTNAFCFVEREEVIVSDKEISEVILVHWNRDYPADTYFKMPLDLYVKNTIEEFPGKSHEKITVEEYVRI